MERPPARKYSIVTIRGTDARTIDKSLLLTALRKNEAKLNQGHYKEFQRQGLFIFSLVTSFSEAPHGEDLKWALYEEMQATMTAYKQKFDFVLVYSEPCGEIYWFNFAEGFIKTEKVEQSRYDLALAALHANQ